MSRKRGIVFSLGTWASFVINRSNPVTVDSHNKTEKSLPFLIRVLPGRDKNEVMGRVTAIANQKGGVGKTTTAVNLGASLAAAERSVLVVDMDPQGNASSGLGYPRGEVDDGVYQALTGEMTLQETVMSTELELLHIVPATEDLAGAGIELVDVENREYRLRNALDDIKNKYDHILIDCPPSLGLLTVNSLVAADTVMVPLQCEYYAMEGLGRLMNTIERIRASFNPGLSLEGILLCMYDPRMNLTKQVADEVRKHFASTVFDTVIPRNVRLGESPSFGKPVILYDFNSKGSRSYLELAKEYLERLSLSSARGKKSND